MTDICITLTVREEKSREFWLTLQELEFLNRQASGYVGTTIDRSPDDKHRLTVRLRWRTRQAVEQYMQSYAFEVLRDALHVLTTSARIEMEKRLTENMMEENV